MSIEVEAEATFGCIQLQRRNTKVEKNTINWMKTVSFADSLKINEIVVNQSNCLTVVAEFVLAYSDGFGVSINAQKPS
jgi:uncharacterized lipoprotein YmbA